MSVKLPYRSDGKVPRPKVVKQYPNGKIPSKLLFPCGLRSFVMVEPAARAMRAMTAAARRDGVVLSATGTWRTYDQQVWMFTDRYVARNTGHASKMWNGKRYWKKQARLAAAASPGTSNHGWGVAADLSDTPSVPLSDKTKRWLAAHGPSFGYWNTVKSEAWHWSYCLGDQVPRAVLDAEAGLGIKPPPKIDWSDVAKVDKELAKITYPGVLKKNSVGVAVRAVQWKLDAAGHELSVDGDFGAKTAAAVKAFQAANDLEADGIVGQVTWGALGLGPRAKAPAKKKAAAKKTTAKKKTAAKKAVATKKPAAKKPAAPAADDEATYTVQDGDGLLKIARLTLWSKRMSDARAIARANNLELDSAIQPGQDLRILSCRSTAVVSGDGWLAVSKRLGRTADEVLEGNAWQGEILHPGMTIYGGKSDR